MQLFTKFNLTTIIEFIVLLALAIKGCFSFIEWAFPRIKGFINRTQQPEKIKYNIKQNLEEINKIKDKINTLCEKIDVLIKSDRDDIKAYITREHHYFVYQKGWIDDYSLDCIERRYSHYVEEGGNSFIKGLMEEIRSLPKRGSDGQI